MLEREMSQSGAAVTRAPYEHATLRSYRQQSEPKRGGFEMAVQLLGSFENMGRVSASSKTGGLRGADVRSAQISGTIKVSGCLSNCTQHYFPFSYCRHT